MCAQRELIEETGFRAAQWSYLNTIIPVPGYSDERIHLYLAQDLSPDEQNLDVDEVIEVHTISIKDVLDMIANGDIQDAKTITGILLAVSKNKLNLPLAP